jgi:hypothetical protein
MPVAIERRADRDRRIISRNLFLSHEIFSGRHYQNMSLEEEVK